MTTHILRVTADRAAGTRPPSPPIASRRDWPLSEREQEVLRLVASGRTDREIADVLCVSHHTVGNHVRHILDKLGVATRAAAVAMAVRASVV
ncbi:MAG TPA: LuxR C-terminal-related transcriptional regulator [Thermomicrobiales bacterium]|nr:LuxR C-terminal-related transcriptional regulator [Thermomicrobiales bacterium]